ncbi:saccharopine dehydrogenase (NAD+, L-glutamate forming) [Micromonospora phaseoli]|uniref:Saccharopine dehydrogenase (NAD+, L-glutamate forming) n=1 Tax=Micromonospora phaseoli TaxID=1144548 RepID=A0A1H7CDA5_9ACTN|nr:saccharopine dehydrogenase NADP-binding domain-containing protein [Micromonospora phaseoli]PZV97897.1 saccharopine dehydrogenase (NAD+, L-glutamate forming) [Micromonospora phaseoli]GIJ78564.1 saccharopine dehydrogenase [Micromonospora phaseoli]SEJ87638.1 saccharopine dehydrogenase (NAD+, L-glutamate forming) [Micromonospora phaseoli]
MAAQRSYDIVLFGATGFTGGLTARYLARHAPVGLRWAIAGRNADKLAAVRGGLAEIDPALAGLPLLTADITDATSMRAVAEQARVVASTVGPFIRYGEPLVAACAAAGTDYLDITGEAEFVDLTYLRHHAEAVRTGARLVHACGFDSIPHDLGVWFTIKQLPDDVPITVDGYVRAGGRFSAGTYHSALTAFSRTTEASQAARERRAVEPRPTDRRVRAVPGRLARSRDLPVWAVPLPTIDPQVVRRSAAARPEYGPDFRYRHFAAVKRLPTVLTAGAGLGALVGLVKLPPTRRWLLGRLASGQGPNAEQRAKSWFTVRFVGTGGGRRVVTEVAGGDPGYDETAKMLAESALCLAYDDLPATCGQVTPVSAMGDALLHRLTAAGITFRVLSEDAAESEGRAPC